MSSLRHEDHHLIQKKDTRHENFGKIREKSIFLQVEVPPKYNGRYLENYSSFRAENFKNCSSYPYESPSKFL